jgi:hypothetical protein
MDHAETQVWFKKIARGVEDGSIDICRRKHYALSLAVGVHEAVHCGYDKIAAVEIGVATGGGLLDLCAAAQFFRDEIGIDIRVFGIDNATGLPPTQGYRDHPEIWRRGMFKMPDQSELRAKLPDFAKLLIGDAGEVVATFEKELEDAKLGFVSIDVDYYSSSKGALEIMKYAPQKYLPAVPMYFDDIIEFLTYNAWCGEELAINEFNAECELRKIQYRPDSIIRHFYVCHVLDHPIRTGAEDFRFPLHITPFTAENLARR